jgi:RNA polymerase sigma factor (sigma-70 family)
VAAKCSPSGPSAASREAVSLDGRRPAKLAVLRCTSIACPRDSGEYEGHNPGSLRHVDGVIPGSRTDEELIAERRPGHAGPAFAEFYARHERAVLAYFARRVDRGEVAADLAAEAFAEALASRARFGGGNAVAWLYGIAAHVLSHSVRRGRVEDRARRRMQIPRLELIDEQVEAIERLGGDDALLSTLSALPADQSAAVRARILEEDSYAEIAARMACSESVVRKRVSRGLAALRQSLEESA